MTADAAPVAPPAPLDALVRRTMARSVVEGVLYAVMVGLGEVYFVADAIRLHASAVVVILVSTLPLFLGSLGSLGPSGSCHQPVTAASTGRPASRAPARATLPDAATQPAITSSISAGSAPERATACSMA